jgi:hypothetical protein
MDAPCAILDETAGLVARMKRNRVEHGLPREIHHIDGVPVRIGRDRVLAIMRDEQGAARQRRRWRGRRDGCTEGRLDAERSGKPGRGSGCEAG